MERADIIIKGRVQKAGYRDFVDEVAFELGLTGYVKNLKDGTVKVVCEGKKEKIEQLIKKIRIREYPIDVREVKVDYSKPTGEFKEFEIIREEKLPEATYERMDMAARYMREMNKDLGNKIEGVGEKMDLGREENRKFRRETNESFQKMRLDYGKISQDLTKAIQGIEKVANNIEKLANATLTLARKK